MSRLLNICWIMSFALLMGSSAQAHAEGQFIDIIPHSNDEIDLILETLESAIPEDNTDTTPIVMMLHGDEADRFLRGSYSKYKDVIDQTAKLAAYNVIDVKVCETWMRQNNYTKADLFPFMNTVKFARSEIKRLKREEDYSEFSVDL